MLFRSGVQFFEILIEGKPTMMEYMWTQPSSIDQAIRILQGFRDFNLTRNTLQSHPYYDMYPAELPKAPLNISVINTGIFPGTTAGKVVLKGSAECLPNDSIKEMKRSITKFLKRLITTDPVLKAVKYKLKWWGMMQEPAITPMDHPLVEILIENGKKELGLVPTAVGAGGSDLRILNLYAQAPTVMYGVDGGNGHGIDEYIEIESLFHTLKIVLHTIFDFCGV